MNTLCVSHSGGPLGRSVKYLNLMGEPPSCLGQPIVIS
jgi:hypothetical protein